MPRLGYLRKQKLQSWVPLDRRRKGSLCGGKWECCRRVPRQTRALWPSSSCLRPVSSVWTLMERGGLSVINVRRHWRTDPCSCQSSWPSGQVSIWQSWRSGWWQSPSPLKSSLPWFEEIRRSFQKRIFMWSGGCFQRRTSERQPWAQDSDDS